MNPITVSRAFQELADEQVVEKRRGLGMYMSENARRPLLSSEKQRFMNDEWPPIAERIKRLGLDPANNYSQPPRENTNERRTDRNRLSKHYGKQAAVDHINLNIEPGRIVGLIGPNGSGKTTTLKAALGSDSL